MYRILLFLNGFFTSLVFITDEILLYITSVEELM